MQLLIALQKTLAVYILARTCICMSLLQPYDTAFEA